MKAREHKEKWDKEPGETLDKLSGAVLEFVNEIKEIGDARRAKTNGAYLSIIDEQREKWKAFMRLLPEGKDGSLDFCFDSGLKAAMPSVWDSYRMGKVDQNVRAKVGRFGVLSRRA